MNWYKGLDITEKIFSALAASVVLVGIIVAILSELRPLLSTYVPAWLLVIAVFLVLLSYLLGRRLKPSYSASRPLFVNRATLEAEEPFEQFVEKGRDVLLAGLTLTGTVGPFRTVFKRAIQRGTNLRFLLLDPGHVCTDLAASFHGVTPKSMRSDIKSSLNYLKQLVDSVNSISNSGTVQVRLLRTIPTASIAMRDGDRDTGEIRCELYLYCKDVPGRPAFRLASADEEDYRRFRDAIEHLWTDSKPWVPKQA